VTKQYVMGVALIEDEEHIALVLNRWPLGDIWSLPGGQVESGESLLDSVVRDAHEETGLLVAPVQLVYVVDAHNQIHDTHFLQHVFSCRVVNGQLSLSGADEFVIDVKWVKRDEVARYITWPVYRDPLLAYLAGHEQVYWLDRDAYRPDEGKCPR
jgi:8-oxo-dGTP diphosphatase